MNSILLQLLDAKVIVENEIKRLEKAVKEGFENEDEVEAAYQNEMLADMRVCYDCLTMIYQRYIQKKRDKNNG